MEALEPEEGVSRMTVHYEPAQIAQDGSAGSGDGAGTAEGATRRSGGSLDCERWRQHSITLSTISWAIAAALGDVPEGHDTIAGNPEEQARRLIGELDELRRQVQAVRELCDHADASEIADRCSLETACVPTHVIRQALGGEA